MEKGCFTKLILIIIALVLVISTCNSMQKAEQERFLRDQQREMEEYRKKQATATPKPTPRPTLDPNIYEIPFVGMREEDINNTRYSRTLEMTLDYFDGKAHKRYYSDGAGTKRDPKYMIVVCYDGVVTLVLDQRNDPWTDVPEAITIRIPESSGGREYDDYYGDAEAFYEDHFDEFEDFDEAEEYYEEHYWN